MNVNILEFIEKTKEVTMKKSGKLIAIVLVLISCFIIAPVVSAVEISGDVDRDGKITTADARLVLRFASGIKTPTENEEKAADINHDGVISIDDVRGVLMMAVDLLSFKEQMLQAGFPVSYVEYLEDLHKKYPSWQFVPFMTGLDWQAAVNGERNPHNKQLIEKDVKAEFKCSCSKCDGVIQEASSWVSASEQAVKYYMDPRNFLNEKQIFQFESTTFNENQTITGIEAILDGTWMHDSSIKYLDANGNEKTYKKDDKTMKYSEAILYAAEKNNISAYYLASKIVQEVGSTSPSNAGGASGENSPYNGIYNYYNIRADKGAADGLRWANGEMKASAKVSMYKSASTDATVVVSVPSGTELYYMGKSGDFYKVKAIVGGTTYKGFILKSKISAETSYGRPWDNPYKSIYYGAKYIYESISEFQFTGYLQKFNVNPKSENIHFHEYMANVRAAAFESEHTYGAYKDAGIMATAKEFCIPVFENMPNADLTREDAFKQSKPDLGASSSTTTTLTLKWESLQLAEKYQVYKYDTTAKEYVRVKTTTDLSYTDSGLKAGETAKYKVRAYYVNDEGETVYSKNSSVFYGALAPKAPTGVAVASKTDDTVKLKWTAVDGVKYAVYRYDNVTAKYTEVGKTSSNAYTDSTASSGTTYKYKIRAYITTDSKSFYSDYSAVVSVKTTGEAVTKSGVVTLTDGYLNVRESASTNGAVVVELYNGDKVTILGETGDWYKIKVTKDGKEYTGYAYAQYVKVTQTKETCPYAEPTATVRQNDSGESVKWVQWYLCKLGYLSESGIDGQFGPTTYSAVVEFQKDYNLDADGLVGSLSRAAMKEAYGS